MSKRKDNTTYMGLNINKLKLIGQGHQGKVYLLPENKVIKVFFKSDSCNEQLEILQRGQNSRFFPTVFNYDKYSIIMSFVDGITLSAYLWEESLGRPLSIELVKLIEEFKSLQFTRLDARIGHIFVQPDKTIKIIDPRGSFMIVQPYPRLMMEGLKKYGALSEFLNNIKDEYPNYYNSWSSKIS